MKDLEGHTGMGSTTGNVAELAKAAHRRGRGARCRHGESMCMAEVGSYAGRSSAAIGPVLQRPDA